MGMDDPDRMASLLLFRTAYQRHPYRFPVIGSWNLQPAYAGAGDAVPQTRYVPNNHLRHVCRRCGRGKSAATTGRLVQTVSRNRLSGFIPRTAATWPPRSSREFCRLTSRDGWHRGHESGRSSPRFAFDISGMGAARGFIGIMREEASHLIYRRFLTRRAIRVVWHRRYSH